MTYSLIFSYKHEPYCKEIAFFTVVAVLHIFENELLMLCR
jgi:hypothetical protein